jgi:hypothetical protein
VRTPCECGDPATCLPTLGLGTCFRCLRLRHIKWRGGIRYGNFCRECVLAATWDELVQCAERIRPQIMNARAAAPRGDDEPT